MRLLLAFLFVLATLVTPVDTAIADPYKGVAIDGPRPDANNVYVSTVEVCKGEAKEYRWKQIPKEWRTKGVNPPVNIKGLKSSNSKVTSGKSTGGEDGVVDLTFGEVGETDIEYELEYRGLPLNPPPGASKLLKPATPPNVKFRIHVIVKDCPPKKTPTGGQDPGNPGEPKEPGDPKQPKKPEGPGRTPTGGGSGRTPTGGGSGRGNTPKGSDPKEIIVPAYGGANPTYRTPKCEKCRPYADELNKKIEELSKVPIHPEGNTTTIEGSQIDQDYRRYIKLKESVMFLAEYLNYCERAICSETPPKEEVGTCPKGFKTIQECFQDHPDLKATLIGDGVNTSKCTLVVQDPVSGETSSTPLHTVCISRKTLKPPAPPSVAQNHTFSIIPTPVPITKILKASKRLAASGQYDDVPLPKDRRNSTIMQLAVWSRIGGNDENSPDAINPKSIKKDLLHKAGVEEKDLSKEEQEEVTKRVDKIFEKVNLTEKESEVPEPEQPKKPDEPKQPEQPGEPGQPQIPGEPEEPNRPEEPGTPTDVSIPHETVCIPEYTTFHCNEEGFQDMCTTEETTIACPIEDHAGTTSGAAIPRISDHPVEPLEPKKFDDCNWRIWKVMRLTRDPSTTNADWEKQILELGTKNLPKSGGKSQDGAKLPNVSKVDTLLDDENELDKEGLRSKNERIIVLAVCIGPEGYVDFRRAFELTDTKAFETLRLTQLNPGDNYPSKHAQRLEALKNLEKSMNTPPPKAPWQM